MARVSQCRCGHPESSHKYEPGFYDVRGHYAECQRVGCYCRKYEWDGKGKIF